MWLGINDTWDKFAFSSKALLRWAIENLFPVKAGLTSQVKDASNACAELS